MLWQWHGSGMAVVSSPGDRRAVKSKAGAVGTYGVQQSISPSILALQHSWAVAPRFDMDEVLSVVGCWLLVVGNGSMNRWTASTDYRGEDPWGGGAR